MRKVRFSLEFAAHSERSSYQTGDGTSLLLAGMWSGRGDFEPAEWRDALARAPEIHNERETEYLIGTPLLADYLEEALDALGYSPEDYKTDRL